MDPLTAGAISGGMGLFGGLLQNEQNRQEATTNRNFQANMSSTAHQREVNDLRAAGLNPILSALGSGASSPGGAQATMQNLGDGISKGMDTAIAIRSQNKQLDLQDADIDLKHDQAKNLAIDRSRSVPEIQTKNWQVKQEEIRTKIMEKTMNAAIKKAQAEGDWAGVNQLMGVISSGASSASDVKDLFNPIKGAIQIKTPKGK